MQPRFRLFRTPRTPQPSLLDSFAERLVPAAEPAEPAERCTPEIMTF
jgi:hypothetical protein